MEVILFFCSELDGRAFLFPNSSFLESKLALPFPLSEKGWQLSWYPPPPFEYLKCPTRKRPAYLAIADFSRFLKGFFRIEESPLSSYSCPLKGAFFFSPWSLHSIFSHLSENKYIPSPTPLLGLELTLLFPEIRRHPP